MPRWLQLLLCLVLFAGAMLLIRVVLHAVAPPTVAWLDSTFGQNGSSVLIVAAFALLAVWVYRANQRQRSSSGR